MKTPYYYLMAILFFVGLFIGTKLATVTNDYSVDVDCMIDFMMSKDLEEMQTTFGSRVYISEDTTIKEIRDLYQEHDKADWLLKIASQVVLSECKIE